LLLTPKKDKNESTGRNERIAELASINPFTSKPDASMPLTDREVIGFLFADFFE
jgi:hypothetical protein